MAWRRAFQCTKSWVRAESRRCRKYRHRLGEVPSLLPVCLPFPRISSTSSVGPVRPFTETRPDSASSEELLLRARPCRGLDAIGEQSRQRLVKVVRKFLKKGGK